MKTEQLAPGNPKEFKKVPHAVLGEHESYSGA
jgi:hypothetical protein